MASLTNTKIKDTYDGLLKTTDNNALGGTYKLITDGLGNSSGVYLGTGGNVGIGATTPDSLIHIFGNTGGTNVPRIKIEATGWSNDCRIERSSGDDGFYITNNYDTKATSADTSSAGTSGVQMARGFVAIHSGASGAFSERMRIDSSGILQIKNSSSPTIQLFNTGTFLQQNDTLGDIDFYQSDASGAGVGVVSKIRAINESGFQGQASLTFQTGTSTSLSERMRIDSSGRVGIGTSSPSTPLEVNVAGNNTVFSLTRDTGTNGELTVRFDGANANFDSLQGGHIFKTGSTERMRIDSSGVVTIGNTSVDPIADRVNGFSAGHNNNGRLKLMQTSTDALLVGRGGSGNVQRFFYNATGSASQVGSISITSSSTSYNTSSDYRLKENVVDMTGALDRVEQLQPKRFNFISDAETTVDGFIAHEVQSVIPEAITGEKDAVDDEGNAQYQGIDQSKIVPLLVGAIKELKAEIETLKSQINS